MSVSIWLFEPVKVINVLLVHIGDMFLRYFNGIHALTDLYELYTISFISRDVNSVIFQV